MHIARGVRLAFVAVPLVLATSAHAAPAELALGDVQLELDPRRDFIDDTNTDPYYRYAGFAQLTGGGHGGGDVGVGASGAVAGLGCDVVAGSAQGRLRFDSTYAGEVNYSLCLTRVLFTVAFSGRRGVGLEPALDARRSLWAQHYDESYDQAELGMGQLWKDDSNHRHTVFVMTLGHGETHQAERTVKTIDLDFFLYRFELLGETAVRFDVLALTSNALKAGVDNSGGVAGAFMPVRVRVETPDFYVAGEAGWGSSGGTVTASSSTEVDGETTSMWTDTIDSRGLPQMTIGVGDLEAGIKRDRLQAAARIARSFYPTFDGNIAREARVAGEVSYVAGQSRRTKLALSPFAARTRTWVRDDGTSLDYSAGASLYVGHQLTRELRLDAIGQAGVSPYTRLGTDAVPQSSLGGQVLVALSARVTDLTTLPRLAR